MFSIDGMSPVVVQEQIEFKATYVATNSSTFLIKKDGNKEITLQRNIFNDTFDMTMPDFSTSNDRKISDFNTQPIDFTTNVNTVNNHIGFLSASDSKDKNNIYFIHSSTFKDAKLRETNSATVVEANRDNGSPKVRFSVFPQIQPIDTNFVLKENEYLDIKTLNSVRFQIAEDKTNKMGQEIKIGNGISYEKSYSHIYIVPRKISQIEHNVILYDAYISNETKATGPHVHNQEKTEHDFLLREGKMASSAISKQMNLTTIKLSGMQHKWSGQNNGEQTPPKYIGSFKIRDFSGYDYEKQKGVAGISANSKQGELIPYNYEGSYSRTTTLGINEIYKKINIIQSLDNTQPVLQPDAGRFMLSIYQNRMPISTTWKTIDQKLFKKESKYIYPLVGLERLADLTERRKNEKAI